VRAGPATAWQHPRAVKKLLRGIAEFRRTRRAEYAPTFARLALGQTPDALLIACSDSRVVPNLFASVEPGDLLVVRNVGNLVPPFSGEVGSPGGNSVQAAIEFATEGLHVRDVVVCGHSECAAIRAIHTGATPPGTPHLRAWLRHAAALSGGEAGSTPGLSPVNHLSQRSVLLQIEHLRSYPTVRRAEAQGRLVLHAWWFDIAGAEVLEHDARTGRFEVLDEDRVERLLAERG
jgi:carbonic anhydrase